MSRWQQAYDALTGERYPALLAHARLLTDGDEQAEALVREAVVAAVSRARRFPPDDVLAVEVRDAISRRAAVLGSPPKDKAWAPAADHPADWDERESALEALAPGAVHHPGDRHHDSVQGVRRAGRPDSGLAGPAPGDRGPGPAGSAAASAPDAAASAAPMRGSPFAPPPDFGASPADDDLARSAAREGHHKRERCEHEHEHHEQAIRAHGESLARGPEPAPPDGRHDPFAPPDDAVTQSHAASHHDDAAQHWDDPREDREHTDPVGDAPVAPVSRGLDTSGPDTSGPDDNESDGGEPDPVEDAFVALDSSTRALVVLYHLDGVSPRRVAALTGMTAPEARRRIDAGADRIGRSAGIVVAPAVVDDALAEVEVTIDAGP